MQMMVLPAMLALALLPAVASELGSCQWFGPSYEVQPGDKEHRAPGAKWPYKGIATVNACAQKCSDNDGCSAFHFYGEGDSASGQCYLHSAGSVVGPLGDGRQRFAGNCSHSPSPPPPTPPVPPSPPPFPPRGPCAKDEDCSLNGECNSGTCSCYISWVGDSCQFLDLQPLPPVAAYGEAPNVTSWGGSIWLNSTAGEYHLYVTEETDGKGLASWERNSQIVHAIASSPVGPYRKQDVVSKPATSNPQILYDVKFHTFLLFHIRGSGSFQLLTSDSVSGPWNSTPFGLHRCNNPTATFHPNGTLYVMCHDSHFSLYSFHASDGKPSWLGIASGPTHTADWTHDRNFPENTNCEDPFLYFDRHARFHVIAHCYTCYWYPSPTRPGKPDPGRQGPCVAGTAWCSSHGFSTTGETGNWTWSAGDNAPYGFTAVTADGYLRNFSTRERPWGLLGGTHGDEWIALVNGVSPAAPGYVKFIAGMDWTYTNIQRVGQQTNVV